jgi:hypothetical protein
MTSGQRHRDNRNAAVRGHVLVVSCTVIFNGDFACNGLGSCVFKEKKLQVKFSPEVTPESGCGGTPGEHRNSEGQSEQGGRAALTRALISRTFSRMTLRIVLASRV